MKTIHLNTCLIRNAVNFRPHVILLAWPMKPQVKSSMFHWKTWLPTGFQASTAGWNTELRWICALVSRFWNVDFVLESKLSCRYIFSICLGLSSIYSKTVCPAKVISVTELQLRESRYCFRTSTVKNWLKSLALKTSLDFLWSVIMRLALTTCICLKLQTHLL